MSPSPRQKYSTRIDELLSLEVALEGPKRTELGPVIGRVLESAGDLLRRRVALAGDEAAITRVLGKVPTGSLEDWADGVDLPALGKALRAAASHAVEAALPDDDDEAANFTTWAMDGLFARDRFESALVALELLGTKGRADAASLAGRLRGQVQQVDRMCRPLVTSLTTLNGSRRPEAGLLDEGPRKQAWWFSERVGIDDDLVVAVLGGEKKGTLQGAEKRAHDVVMHKRVRRISSDDLLRYDLGLASPAERDAILSAAEKDPELKLALAAMAEAEKAIEGDGEPDRPVTGAPTPLPIEPSSAPAVVEDNPDFKVLVFRSPKSVQVVVQPRSPDRLAAAAVFREGEPARPVVGTPSSRGLEFDLGDAGRLKRTTARVTVRLADGQARELEVPL